MSQTEWRYCQNSASAGFCIAKNRTETEDPAHFFEILRPGRLSVSKRIRDYSLRTISPCPTNENIILDPRRASERRLKMAISDYNIAHPTALTIVPNNNCRWLMIDIMDREEIIAPSCSDLSLTFFSSLIEPSEIFLALDLRSGNAGAA
jgi:hypothetical protein